jgi:N-acetylneuraminate lyase
MKSKAPDRYPAGLCFSYAEEAGMINEDKKKYSGINIALYACYSSDGGIDVKAVKRICRFYTGLTVSGLYVGGSSGEGLLQNVDERKQTAEAALDETGGKIPVIVHVGAPATRDAAELAAHAEASGADAVSAVPNVYYPIPEHGIEKHWCKIMERTSLPFIIYNIPQLTGYNLTLSLLKRMAEIPQVIGVKNSSLSTFQIQQFKTAGGPGFIVFNGPDDQYLAGRIMGADAGIGGTYGIMPELYLQIEKHFAAGNIKEAQKWQYRVNSIITELRKFPSIQGAMKEIMKLRGFNIGIPRMPLESVSADQYPEIRAVHKKIEEYRKSAG